MRNQRSFSVEFKRQAVEELLSGESRPAQLCRRYNISSSLLYHWKRQYSRGRFKQRTRRGSGSQGQDREAGAAGRQADPGKRVLKKGLTVQPQSASKKREIVTRWKHFLSSIRRRCGLMKLARSSFYYRPKAKSPERMEAEADLRDRIEAICLEFPRYGYRRVTHQLKHEGKLVNHKKVLRLMKKSD